MSPKVSPSTAFQALEKAELDAVLESGIFARAPSLAQFLSYVCRKYFDGESEQIKEYNIAVEALGRRPEFDQKSDAVVRVQALRLRKRLKQYYKSQGAAHQIELSIPPGSYVPVFQRKPQQALTPRQRDLSPTVPLTLELAPPRSKAHWFVIAGLAIAGAVFVASQMARVDLGSAGRADSLALLPEGTELRILAGAAAGKYVDRLGRIWLSDRFFTGGSSLATPDRSILRTADQVVYQSRREGNFQYDIPLKPAVYQLQLHFAETVFGAGADRGGGETSRLFDVSANGKPLLTEFDVISDAGGSNAADVKAFKDISPAADGVLHLVFRSRREGAILSGIELFPSAQGHIRPVRILAQEATYVDKQDRVWSVDRFFLGGQTVLRETPVKNAAEPAIYRGERYGNFTYTIPVAPGRYRLTLKFAETWFGPKKPGGGGAGSRRFDVYCNGVALLKNFDIYKEAGGSDLALDRTFTGLQPNAQDKFVISFVPIRNYACVNALEVE